VRDGAGLAVDIATDPVTYVFSPGFSYVIGGVTAVQFRADSRDEYESLKRTSVDFYATLRSLYRQIRAQQISNGEVEQTALSYELTGVGVSTQDDSNEESLNQ
jgi:phospholipid-binding lipoprotein MlaA